jgi:hypothetical protein
MNIDAVIEMAEFRNYMRARAAESRLSNAYMPLGSGSLANSLHSSSLVVSHESLSLTPWLIE